MAIILNMIMAKGTRNNSKNQTKYGLTISTRLDENTVNDIRISAQKLGLTMSKYLGILVQKGQYETELIDSLNLKISELQNEILEIKKTRAEAVGMFIKKIAKREKDINKYIENYNDCLILIDDRKDSAKTIRK